MCHGRPVNTAPGGPVYSQAPGCEMQPVAGGIHLPCRPLFSPLLTTDLSHAHHLVPCRACLRERERISEKNLYEAL